MKPAGCLNSPLGAVVIPRSATSAVDAEVELAIVLACDCKNVDVTSAADYILGFTTANDITCRDVQGKTSQWGYCKGYDGFCPLGPTLISAKHLPEPLQLRMTTTIDGSVIQDGTTTDMIFSPEEIVSYLSQVSFSEYAMMQLLIEQGYNAAPRHCNSDRDPCRHRPQPPTAALPYPRLRPQSWH